jgi:hypothetical protein
MPKAIGFASIRHVRIGTSSTAVVLGTDTSGIEAEAFFRLDDISAVKLLETRRRRLPYRPRPRTLRPISRTSPMLVYRPALLARARPPDSAMAMVAIS